MKLLMIAGVGVAALLVMATVTRSNGRNISLYNEGSWGMPMYAGYPGTSNAWGTPMYGGFTRSTRTWGTPYNGRFS